MDVFFALPTFSPVLRCPFPNFDAAKRRVNVIFLRGEDKSVENKGVIGRWSPDFTRKVPVFTPSLHPYCAVSQRFAEGGEAVKAKNKKLLRRRRAHTRACARESAFTQRKGRVRRNGIALPDRGRKRAEAQRNNPRRSQVGAAGAVGSGLLSGSCGGGDRASRGGHSCPALWSMYCS